MIMMSEVLFSILRIQKRIGELSDHIADINREETLFKWSQSTYPQLDTIGTAFRTS